MTEVKIIADSISEAGKRITTIQMKFHRFVLAEFNTHRMFSRNFSSSRAIPTKKLLDQVRNDPAMPVWWGKNQAGMQAPEELDGPTKQQARGAWREAAVSAAYEADRLVGMGVHKQIVNRLIEPFVWVNGIVTSTEWDNFFALRCHPDAQPEIQALAYMMRDAMDASEPWKLAEGQWHLPYITQDELQDNFEKQSTLLTKISAARCCRVSYDKQDGLSPDVEEDLLLFERLAGSVPIHASPLEHQASPFESPYTRSGNFIGWSQFRHEWEARGNLESR